LRRALVKRNRSLPLLPSAHRVIYTFLMRRFFAQPDSFSKETVTLDADETRHLKNVLRLRTGDAANVFDGNGREFSCVIESIERDSTHLKILEEVAPASKESLLELHVAAALLKGEKFDFVVQKLSELGVRQIIPVITHRCDVEIRSEADALKKVERWKRISFESSKQCGRAAVSRVEVPISFNKFVADVNSPCVLFAEEGGESFEEFARQNSAVNKIISIIGPEGGWEASEIALAREKGIRVVTLKGRIMRAETASIVTSALLQHKFGDLK